MFTPRAWLPALGNAVCVSADGKITRRHAVGDQNPRSQKGRGNPFMALRSRRVPLAVLERPLLCQTMSTASSHAVMRSFRAAVPRRSRSSLIAPPRALEEKGSRSAIKGLRGRPRPDSD